MNQRLEGKRAIVTGGARGIGREIALTLVREGASVLVNDIADAALEEGIASIEHEAKESSDSGQMILGHCGDLTRPEVVEALVDEARIRLGGLDVVVNNAGSVAQYTVAKMPIAEWERTVEINLTVPFMVSKASLPLLEQQGGRIVNIASIAGKRISVHGGAAYTAAKAGLIAFTRHLAYECAPSAITVNAVCPGGISTEKLESLMGTEGRVRRLKNIPIGRFLAPSEVAQTVAWLASDACSGITGIAVDVDGGSSLGWEPADDYLRWMGAKSDESSVEEG